MQSPIPPSLTAADLQNRMNRIRRFMFLLFFLLAFLLTVSGYLIYRFETASIKQSQINNLKAIAELKAGQLAAWRQERLNDAFLDSTGIIRSDTLEWLKSPENLLLKGALINRLNQFCSRQGYETMILAGIDGKCLLASDDTIRLLDKNAGQLINQAVKTNAIVFGDFYQCDSSNKIYLDIAAPVRNPEDQPIAALILRTDPNQFLYPFLKAFPIPSETGETLLVRKDGDQALFLSPLRHSNALPLTLRIPLSQSEIIAAAAAGRGLEGIMEGKDYRGISVVADIHPISGAAWKLIVKIDADELFADLDFISMITTGYMITLLLLLACGAGLFYKHISKRILQERFTMENERAELMARSHVTLHSIGDAVITTDRSGQVTQMNPTAESLTGWREADALSKPLSEVFHIISETTREPVENPVSRVLQEGITVGLANHTLLISKDGEERPIADSAAPVRKPADRDSGDEILGVVLVFRDQTEERQAQDTIQHEKENLQAILTASPVCLLLLDETGKIVLANPTGVRLSGKTAEQIVGSACGDLVRCVNRLEENRGCGGSTQCPSCPLRTAIQHHFSTGDSILHQEIEIVEDSTHHGNRHWYQYSIEPVLISNQRLAILALYDISDIKGAEKDFRLLFENAMMGIAIHEMIMDTEGNPVDYVFLDANAAFETTTGLKTENIIGRKVTDVLSDIDLTFFIRTYGEVVLSGKPVSFEKYIEPMQRHFLISAYPIGANKFATVVQNITDSKEADAEREITIKLLSLVSSTNNLDQLLELVIECLKDWSGCEAIGIRLQDGEDFPYYMTTGFPEAFVKKETHLCAVNQNGEIIRDSNGNPVLECMCGNVICGRFDPSLPFFTEYGSFWTNSTTHLLASTSEADRQARTRNRCNGEGYESVALIPLRHAGINIGLLQINDSRENRFNDRKILLFQRLASNLAVGLLQHNTAKALRENEGQLRSLVNGLPDIVMRFDRNGRHLYVSDNVTSVVDIEAAQFIGKTHRELGFSETYCQFWEAAIDGVFNTNKPFETEFAFESRKGRVFFQWRLLPEPDAQGAIRSVLSLSRDITHTRQTGEENINLSAQLEQAQKMESIGRLAGGVAHDFNNMLGVISCHSEIILEDIDPNHPLHASMLAIQEATRRSASVVRQLLAFARKQTVNPQILNINKAISSMLNLLKRIIGENITLLWEPGADIRDVNIDPSQIDQILANLLVNAKDAIASVGTITIETHNITLDDLYCATHAGASPGEYVMVSVSDTGMGMEKNILDHIFEPFFTTKPSDKGTGLGLATVYGVVKQNNGYIDVKSAPGSGTTFMLYFPYAKGPIISETLTAAGEERQTGSETLLLVEDEEEILKSTGLFLKRYGYTVLSAARPSEAIQIKKEFNGQIHLMITDVVMPEMNGKELFDILHKEDPGLKCLYLSGYAEEIIASQGGTNGFVHLLPKPFSMKQLTRKIRELIGGGGGRRK